MILFLIGLGGALGSIARYLFSSLVLRLSGTLFPAGTFAVNLVGCVMFGAIIGAAQQRFVLTPENGGTTVERTVVFPEARGFKGFMLSAIVAPGPFSADARKTLKRLKSLAEA